MIKNYITLALLGLIVIAILVGYTKGKDAIDNNLHNRTTDAKDTLTMAIGSEPDGGFDPILGWGRYGSPLIQSTLVKTNADMEIVGDLAEEYTISDDGLTLTFYLRKDAYFTDGEQVTADDVVFTFNKAKESASIVDFTVLDLITAVDSHTVEIKLKEPQSTIIYSIAKTGIVQNMPILEATVTTLLEAALLNLYNGIKGNS